MNDHIGELGLQQIGIAPECGSPERSVRGNLQFQQLLPSTVTFGEQDTRPFQRYSLGNARIARTPPRPGMIPEQSAGSRIVTCHRVFVDDHDLADAFEYGEAGEL